MPFRSPSVHIERADLARMASSTAVGKRGERGWPAGCERAMLERARALIPPLPERAPAAAAIDVATPLLHVGREASTAAVSSGRNITEAEALRARLDMVYAQHQVGWALERPCEMDGARWVYDSDELGAIRRDVMTILTHHAVSRQAAMAPYGRMLLARDAG